MRVVMLEQLLSAQVPELSRAIGRRTCDARGVRVEGGLVDRIGVVVEGVHATARHTARARTHGCASRSACAWEGRGMRDVSLWHARREPLALTRAIGCPTMHEAVCMPAMPACLHVGMHVGMHGVGRASAALTRAIGCPTA